jgi:hypothetical protein
LEFTLQRASGQAKAWTPARGALMRAKLLLENSGIFHQTLQLVILWM